MRIVRRIWEDIYNYRFAILCVIFLFILLHLLFEEFCPMVVLTGLPCAGCGMTRAAWELLTFQFADAWQLNPAIFAWVPFVLYCIVIRYFLGRKVKYLKTILIVVLAVTFAVYGYRLIVEFPGTEPMVFNENNYFQRLFPKYERIIMAIWER